MREIDRDDLQNVQEIDRDDHQEIDRDDLQDSTWHEDRFIDILHTLDFIHRMQHAMKTS